MMSPARSFCLARVSSISDLRADRPAEGRVTLHDARTVQGRAMRRRLTDLNPTKTMPFPARSVDTVAAYESNRGGEGYLVVAGAPLVPRGASRLAGSGRGRRAAQQHDRVVDAHLAGVLARAHHGAGRAGGDRSHLSFASRPACLARARASLIMG